MAALGFTAPFKLSSITDSKKFPTRARQEKKGNFTIARRRPEQKACAADSKMIFT
jgi:hypothetical protein